MSFVNRIYKRIKQFLSQHYPNLYQLCNRRKSSIKFFFAGGTAALLNILLLIIFHDWLKWGLIFSTSIAFIFAFFLSFTLQKFWAFRNYHYKKIPIQFILYIINAIIGLNINGFLMHLAVNKWGIWYLLAQIGVSLLIGLYNFLAYNFVIFRQKQI